MEIPPPGYWKQFVELRSDPEGAVHVDYSRLEDQLVSRGVDEFDAGVQASLLGDIEYLDHLAGLELSALETAVGADQDVATMAHLNNVIGYASYAANVTGRLNWRGGGGPDFSNDAMTSKDLLERAHGPNWASIAAAIVEAINKIVEKLRSALIKAKDVLGFKSFSITYDVPRGVSVTMTWE